MTQAGGVIGTTGRHYFAFRLSALLPDAALSGSLRVAGRRKPERFAAACPAR